MVVSCPTLGSCPVSSHPAASVFRVGLSIPRRHDGAPYAVRLDSALTMPRLPRSRFVHAFTSAYRRRESRRRPSRWSPMSHDHSRRPRPPTRTGLSGSAGGDRRPAAGVPAGAAPPRRGRPRHRLQRGPGRAPPGSTPRSCARTCPTSARTAPGASGTTSPCWSSRSSHVLGLTQRRAVALVGVGNLGHALAGYAGFATRGFRIAALLDADPARVGEQSTAWWCVTSTSLTRWSPSRTSPSR